MNVKIGIVSALALATALPARAADWPVSIAGRPIYAGPSRRLAVNPECLERNTRLLSCLPPTFVAADDPRVLQTIDAPPRVRLRPYPEIFSW